MNRNTVDMLNRLHDIGISSDDALALRRISMTLHKWHEDECGDSNDKYSRCLVRGNKANGKFHYDDEGKPYWEVHWHSKNKARYTLTLDRETGARKRLAKIMARYPELVAYVQTDPRAAALYILNRADLGERDISSCYYRGVAVYR